MGMVPRRFLVGWDGEDGEEGEEEGEEDGEEEGMLERALMRMRVRKAVRLMRERVRGEGGIWLDVGWWGGGGSGVGYVMGCG